MTPSDPPGEPPSGGVPRATDPTSTGQITGPVPMTGPIAAGRARSQTLFGEDGPFRRFIKRWGFPLFVLFVVVLGRSVLLPFVFAGLIAYILAPVVRWMSEREDGTRRMPRGVAIIICYLI